MANGADGSIVIDTALDSTGFQADSKKLLKAISSVKSQIESLGAKVRSGFSTSGQIANFIAQTEKAQAKVESLRERLEEFGGQTFQTGAYSDLLAEKEKAEKALLKLYDRREAQEDNGVSENSQAWKRLTIQIQNAEAEVQRYEAALSAMETNGTAFVQGNQTPEYGAALSQLTEMAQQVENYRERASTPPELSGWDQFGQIMRSVGNAVGGGLSAMARAPFTLFSRGIAAATNKLKQFVTQSHKARAGTHGLLRGLTSLKTMLFSRVKRMFISAIINGIQDGIKALAQFSTEFNTSMSNIKNASKGLSANLSVSLGGLINAIEPVVTRIINAISRAISYLNALFAMLGGKSTVTVAKKQMDSYADSAAGAGGAVKELKRQVYGFDELNKRSKDSDGGGGGGGSNAGDLFEEVPIDSLLPDTPKGLFDRIKAAYEANDWADIGRVIADGLNMGVKAVDNWITGTLQPKAVTWAQRTGQLINGIVKGADFALMGKTLADGINTAIYFLATAIETIDWRTLGEQLATGLYSLISNIDLGRLVEGINALAIGFFNFFSGAIQAINWQQVGADLYNAIKTMVTTLDYGGIVSALAEAFGSFIGGLAGLLWGFIETAISDLGDWMKEAFYENGEFTWEGFCNGIVDAVKGIGDWIVEHIFDPFIGGFKAAFGINSPSTVMKEQGGYIAEGLLLGITDGWADVKEFFSKSLSDLETGLQNAWDNIKTGASTAWDNIKTAATKPFSAMKTTIGNTDLSSLKMSLSNGWQSIQTTANSAWSGISSSVSSKWNALKSSMQSTSWYSVGSNICSGILNGINDGWDWLVSTVSNLASGLLNAAKWALGIHSPSRVFRDEVGENIGLGIAEGVTDTKADVIKAVSSVAQSAADGIESSKIKLGVDSSISGLGVVADKLADIAASFHSIISMLTSLGGLSIPQIAAGSVVPVKTRISGHDGYADYPGVKETDFDDYMRQVYSVLRDILDESKRPKRGIDLDTLTREITRRQKRLSHSYGI